MYVQSLTHMHNYVWVCVYSAERLQVAPWANFQDLANCTRVTWLICMWNMTRALSRNWKMQHALSRNHFAVRQLTVRELQFRSMSTESARTAIRERARGMCHVWMSHVARTNQSFHLSRTNESCHTYEWVVSHIQMSRVTHINDESCLTYKRVMSCTRMSRVTHTNESCHTYEWYVNTTRFVSHIWMSRVTHMNDDSCLTYE